MEKQKLHGKREAARDSARTVRRLAAALLLTAVLLLNLFTYAVHVVRYHGGGMAPALKNGQVLLVLNTRKAEPGDVVAFYYNNKLLVRRVICGGGSEIDIGEDGAVRVDGQPLTEPYVAEPSLGQCDLTFPYYVPPGSVFVMGDDRVSAMDSRLSAIGPVSQDRIYGRVLFTD